MNLNKEDREQLIKYRLNQATETKDVVEFLIANNKLNTAVNRIYYGIFYSLLALSVKYGFQSSKHLQLIGWFNKNFISTKKIDLEYGRILREAYERRRTGDYDAYVEFDKNVVESLFIDMQKFIFFIIEFIEKEH